jgi:hypothetical protein
MKKMDIKLDFDPQKILAWAKSNILLVVLLIVSIAAAVGLPMFAASWRSSLEQELTARAKNFRSLDSLEKTSVTPPGGGQPQSVLVNRQLVDRYSEIADAMKADADEVLTDAMAINQRQHKVLFAGQLFPSPPSQAQMETMPQKLHRDIDAMYLSLLQEIRAGEPPAINDLAASLEKARVFQFLETQINKKPDAELTPDERSQLETFLSEQRLSLLHRRAGDIGVYANEDILGIPRFDLQAIPGIGELFNWQWRLWAVSDVIGAVATTNGEQSELTAPIKHLVSLDILGLPIPDEAASASGTSRSRPSKPRRGSGPPKMGGPGGGGGGGSMGVGPPDAGYGSGGSVHPPEEDWPGMEDGGSQPQRPNAGEPMDATESFTGHASGVYDILQAQLTMVVSTARVPDILDGFSEYGFMTVLDIDLQPVDKFEALRQGYDYGPGPASELTVVLELAWLRAWTVEYMPDSVKRPLGLASPGSSP